MLNIGKAKQQQILRSFGIYTPERFQDNSDNADIEKARNVGDVHPSKPWVWTEYKPGRFDWRIEKQSVGDKNSDTPDNNDNVDKPEVDMESQFKEYMKKHRKDFKGVKMSDVEFGVTNTENGSIESATVYLEDRRGIFSFDASNGWSFWGSKDY